MRANLNWGVTWHVSSLEFFLIFFLFLSPWNDEDDGAPCLRMEDKTLNWLDGFEESECSG